MKKPVKIWIFLIIILVVMAFFIRPSENQVRRKMEKALLKQYGEEFVVENIGLRDANGDLFYEARIYPKSIIGTPKENDKYYYGKAIVDLKRFYAKNSVGDTYGEIRMNDEAESFLLPKAKELFGDKVRIKADIKYEELKDNYYVQHLVSGFIDKRDKALNNPETQRLVIEAKIFVFDKIDNKEEEEERKKQLFEFLQYLRKEKLDKYLLVDCNFMDDIVLAPSFGEDRYTLEESEDKEEKSRIEKKLREEVKKLSEKDFLDNMNGILKSEFDYTDGDLAEYPIGIMQILSLDYMRKVEPARYSSILQGDISEYNYKSFNDIDYDNRLDYLLIEEDK